MSRYVLTQEQLDRLQTEVQHLARLNESKQERIKDLEIHKVRLLNEEAENSKATAERLTGEIKDFKNSDDGKNLESVAAEKLSVTHLQMLLKEERKLREYSETFAKQAGLKWAEESLLRELTSELCELQRAEIEIDNKRIQELQEKLDKLMYDAGNPQGSTQEKIKQINTDEKEEVIQNKQLNSIMEQLRSQLRGLSNEITKHPVTKTEDLQQAKEVEKWTRELDLLVKDINDIESLKKDLKYMKNEIENRRKSLLKHQN